MKMKYLVFLLSVSLLSSAQAKPLHSEEHHHLGAHVHGVAHLSIAMFGGEIQVELQAPASDIVGFEHKPETQEQKEAIEQAIEVLRGGEWLQFQQAADCSLQNATATSSQLQGSGHGDFFAELYFQCNTPTTPDYLQTSFFEHFPTIDRIDTQWLNESRQGRQDLTQTTTRLRFN